MIKVDCPSCQASYDLDERRVPDKGMKMRCPKCSSSFFVGKSGSVTSGSAPPAAAAPTAPAVPAPPAKGGLGRTMLGAAVAPVAAPPKAPEVQASPDPTEKAAPSITPKAPAAGAFGGSNKTLIAGAAPPMPQAPAAPVAPTPAAPVQASPAVTPTDLSAPKPVAPTPPTGIAGTGSASSSAFGGSKPRGTVLGVAGVPAAKPKSGGLALGTPDGDNDGDLPVPKHAPPPTALFSMKPPSPAAKTTVEADIDLPAPSPRNIAPAFPGGAPKPAAFAAPVPKPAAIAPAFTAPVPKPAAIAPPFAAPVPSGAPAQQATPQQPDIDLDLPAPKKPNFAATQVQQGGPFASPTPPEDVELDLPARKEDPIESPEGAGPAFAAPVRHQPPQIANAEVELDLPAVKAAVPGSGLGDLELDLPAPRQSAPGERRVSFVDLPAPKVEPGHPSHQASKQGDSAAHGDHIDLPRPKAPAPQPGGQDGAFGIELDLPAPKPDNVDLPQAAYGAGGDFGNLDLPNGDPGLDLPRPAEPSDDFGPELDLPVAQDEVNLPAPVNLGETLDLPTVAGEIDLPTAQGDIDLPTAFGGVDLPVAQGAGGVDLPGSLPGFGDLDLTLPDDGSGAGGLAGSADLPQPATGGLDDLELPAPLPNANLLPPKERTVQGVGAFDPNALSGGDSELPPSLMSDETSFGDIDLGDPEPDAPAPNQLPEPDHPPAVNTGLPEPIASSSLDQISAPPAPMGGPMGAFGEEDFGDDQEDELYEDEEMEFGIDDGEDGRNFSLPPEVLRRRKGQADADGDAKKGPRAALILGGVGAMVLLITLGGVGLGMFTHHGYFGVYFIERFLPESATPAFAQSSIERAEKTAVTDTYADVKQSLYMLGEARGKAGLNRALLTRSLLHECLSILRFGDSSESASHAAAIVRRLEERGNQAPGITLALAADKARAKKWPEALKLLKVAIQQAPNDPYAHLLQGEIALARHDGKAAEAAFATALKHGAGARAQWGLARAAARNADQPAQLAAVDATLRASPRHVEAQIADARSQWQKGNVERALDLLLRAVGETTTDGQAVWTSDRARAAAYSVIGYVQETSGRLHLARTAYSTALQADSTRVEAMLGAARVMLRERRFSDALARFESATTAAKQGNDPVVLSGRKASAEAQLGIGRTMLELDRAPEAKKRLADLSARHPNDHEIARALGNAEQALNNVVAAEDQYRRAMELAPQVFEGYLALAELFSRQGRADKASEVLNQAAAQVEETAEMRRMLGLAELSRNHVRGAIHEFERALELDPADLEAKFGLGRALRIDGQLPQATAAFELIAKRDPAFAGLAMERGLLREATGNYEGAINVYNTALAKDPSNLRLLLRLGAAQVEAGLLDAADLTLHKVLQAMPNSAEAEYFIGRVAFARGRTPDALTHFDRALSLDGRQGEFHLYAARATLEMGNLGRTLEEAEMAIRRDPGLGDGFWVRGMVRLRMGAVQDALRDFRHANKLNPNRIEAYVGMGDCFDQIGQLQLAAQAYRTALEHMPDRGLWWYRLSQIKQDGGKRKEAEELGLKAIALGEAVARDTEAPYWLADAYRMTGDLAKTRRDRKKAIARYLRYLDTAAPGHLDRKTVQSQLTKWDVQWRKDDLGF